jgi:hypothetical protein
LNGPNILEFASFFIHLFIFPSLECVGESHTTLFPLSSLTLPNGKDSTKVDGLAPLKGGKKRGNIGLNLKFFGIYVVL